MKTLEHDAIPIHLLFFFTIFKYVYKGIILTLRSSASGITQLRATLSLLTNDSHLKEPQNYFHINVLKILLKFALFSTRLEAL